MLKREKLLSLRNSLFLPCWPHKILYNISVFKSEGIQANALKENANIKSQSKSELGTIPNSSQSSLLQSCLSQTFAVCCSQTFALSSLPNRQGSKLLGQALKYSPV